MKRILFTLALYFAFANAASCGDLITLKPDRIIQLIDKTSAEAVVSRLRRAGQMDQVYELIAGGDKEWLRAAAKLAPGTGGDASNSMTRVLIGALARNPEPVLEFNSLDDVRAVCSADFIEPTDEFLDDYFKTVLSKLEQIKDAALDEKKQRCIGSIAEARDEFVKIREREASSLDIVKRESPEKALDKLIELGRYELARDKISLGNRDWIMLLPLIEAKLASRQDASDWVSATRYALMENPAPVLDVLSKNLIFINVQNVCSSPAGTRQRFIDEDKAKLLKAFAKIRDEMPQFVPTMDACIKQMSAKLR